MKRFCLAAIALGVFAGGCSSDPVGPPPRITALPRSLTPHEQSLIQADNRLAIKLLQQVNADTRDTLPNLDRKSTRLNSSHVAMSYAVFCLTKKKNSERDRHRMPISRLGDYASVDHHTSSE